MKALAELLLIAVVACIVSIAAGGCAALTGGSDSIDAGAVIQAAAAGASGDYAKALAQIAKIVEKREGKTDPLAGYSFTRTYFYDGTPVPDASRITWQDTWTKTGSAGKADVPPEPEATPAGGADDALAEEIAAILTGMGLAE